jgi:pimeloyl-ACP methyl ester carboxylesterase
LRRALTPTLAFETVGNGTRIVLFAHGILGQGRNWRSFARKLTDRAPDWTAVLVDLRNHGASPALAPPHDLAACAGDLEVVAQEVGAPEIAVGHSFGAKVVLTWARRARPRAVWLLDSPPSGGTPGPPSRADDPRTVIAHLRGAPVPAPDRDVLKTFLRARGLSESVVAWLLTSARPDADGWRFVYDLDGVEQMLRSYLDTDVWPQLDATPFPVHLVRGSRSPVWSPPDLARLAALPADGPVDVSVVDAGHWVHVDNPNGVLALLNVPT